MQPEIIDYVIVSEYITEIAQKRIKALMYIGLQPYGSPSVYVNGANHLIYVQAMVKYKQPQKEPLT